MNRTKLYNREIIDTDLKMLALSKSNNRCCHCGCKFNYKHKFTIEHVIPLSKGGSNKLENLVALCDVCNSKKNDDIILPTEYFHYLKPEFSNILMKNQKDYYEALNWFTPRNFFKEDKIVISVPVVLSSFKKRNKGRIEPTMKYVIEKGTKNDLEGIFILLKEYNEKLGINQTDEEVWEIVNEQYKQGVFYIIKNKEQEIVFIMPLLLKGTSNNNGSEGIVTYMNGFISKYHQPIHRIIAYYMLDALFTSLTEIPIKYTNEKGFVVINVCKRDVFALEALTGKADPAGNDMGEDFIEITMAFSLNKDQVKDNAKQRGVSPMAQYSICLKKYLEKNGHSLACGSITVPDIKEDAG